MLHQQPSKPTKLWKFGIAAPILIAFVLLFNVRTVAQYQFTETVSGPNPGGEPTATLQAESLDFMIKKDMSEPQLEAIKTDVAAKGGEFNWKKIKRNDQGIITRIAVEFSYGNSNASASYENPEGIEAIYLGVKADGSVYISSGQEVHSSKELIWIQKDGNTSKITGKEAQFIVVEETVEGGMDADGELHEKVTVKVKELEEGDSTSGKRFVVKKLPATGEIEKIHVVRLDGSTQTTKPLYIIDGEEVEDRSMRTTEPGNITHIEVLKGDKAIATYGEKGRNGVILITTKGAKDKVSDLPAPPAPPAPPAINEIDLRDTAVFIDGKEASEKELKALSPESIDNMEVMKGKKAMDTYGKPAAILITTKK